MKMMKMLTETRALADLRKLKSAFRKFIKTNYEHRAKDCLTCETRGACCTDAHFVNVHITRLEAAAIRRTLGKLPREKQSEVFARVEKTIEKYDLHSERDSFKKTFACPLFEKEIGCLVHNEAKPASCIAHACYENREDLPPEEMRQETELEIEKLNQKVYRNAWSWRPLPVWIKLQINSDEENERILMKF